MFPIKAFLVTTSLCCLIEYGYGKSLDVAAFNIQVFGQAKVSNKDVVTNLVRVSWMPASRSARYDSFDLLDNSTVRSGVYSRDTWLLRTSDLHFAGSCQQVRREFIEVTSIRQWWANLVSTELLDCTYDRILVFIIATHQKAVSMRCLWAVDWEGPVVKNNMATCTG